MTFNFLKFIVISCLSYNYVIKSVAILLALCRGDGPPLTRHTYCWSTASL